MLLLPFLKNYTIVTIISTIDLLDLFRLLLDLLMLYSITLGFARLQRIDTMCLPIFHYKFTVATHHRPHDYNLQLIYCFMQDYLPNGQQGSNTRPQCQQVTTAVPAQPTAA
jgi:hypothetical protein